MTSSWQLEVEMNAKNILRPENKSTYSIDLTCIDTMKYNRLNIARTDFFVRVVCALKHSIYLFFLSTKHDFDLNKAYTKLQPQKNGP